MKYKKGDIVYINGLYKAIIESDEGSSFSYRPLEGCPENQKGKVFSSHRGCYKLFNKRIDS